MEELKGKENELEADKTRYEQKVKESLQKSLDDEMAQLRDQRKKLEAAEVELEGIAT